MYFQSILSFAVLATAATAAAVPTSPLNTREEVCGQWFDNFLGPNSGGNVLGTGQCQQMKKAGENPNDQSTYTFHMKAACIHCNLYSDENCGSPTASVGNDQGRDWDHEWPYGVAKSFIC